MTRAAELKKLLDPARGPRESFKAYRRRRATANASVKAHLKGRMAHVSTQVAVIPEVDWKDEHAQAVIRGKLIVMGTAVVGTKPVRLVRTKGVTYRKAA